VRFAIAPDEISRRIVLAEQPAAQRILPVPNTEP
jgi:hypothetical protein